ncbi:MAG: ExeA family protein [Lachnospira sp.]
MYEEFFELMHTPFTRDIPADRQLFAVVTADPGCGKSTLIRMFESRLPKDKYMLLYLSDSKLTPRWLYAGLLDQMGLEARFYRGDSKRQLQKETLEEFRFLLNYRFDSASPMSLILVGQTELWDQKLRLQSYAAIRQRIDMNIVLNRLDRAETGKYIAAHMAYAGVKQDLFTSGAEDEIFKVSAGIPRMINRICEKTLMYAYQQQKRLIDEHIVRFVADHEMVGGIE